MSTYYVRSTGGSDGNDGLSFANGFATMEKAVTVAGSGHVLNICSSSVNPLNFNSIFAAGATYIIVRGCSLLDGSPFNGSDRAYVRGVAPVDRLFTYPTSNTALLDLDCNGGTNVNYGAWVAASDRGAFISNCKFYNCKLVGVVLAGYSNSIRGCEATLNLIGVYISSSAAYYGVSVINCAIHHNTQQGIQGISSAQAASIVGCRVFRNGTTTSHHGITVACPTSIMNTVITNNTGHGIISSTGNYAYITACLNNIIANNGAYGVYIGFAQYNLDGGMDYNCFYNNASGDVNSNINGGVIPGYHNVTSDPLFVSTTDGSEDFSLQAGSPCLNTGFGFESGQ